MGQSLAAYLERRTGPRKVAITDTDVPATLWNPLLPGMTPPPSSNRFVRLKPAAAALPPADDAIAFSAVSQLSRWIESRQLTSERLTNIYLARIERLDGRLRSVITVTRDHALAQAKAADAEIAAGKYRGPGPFDSAEEIDGPAIETLVLQELRATNDNLDFGYQIHAREAVIDRAARRQSNQKYFQCRIGKIVDGVPAAAGAHLVKLPDADDGRFIVLVQRRGRIHG